MTYGEAVSDAEAWVCTRAEGVQKMGRREDGGGVISRASARSRENVGRDGLGQRLGVCKGRWREREDSKKTSREMGERSGTTEEVGGQKRDG